MNKFFLVTACMICLIGCKKFKLKNELPAQWPPKPAGFISNPKNLNIVYFVPKDNPAVPGYKERLSDLFTYFQRYIQAEMIRNGYPGKTIGLPLDLATKRVKIITIQGTQSQTVYDYGSFGIIIDEINTYKTTHAAEFSGVHSIILLPQRTVGTEQPFYGLGKNCFAVDNANINVGQIPITTSNFIGGMLHELGHGLGLPHNMAKVSEQPILGTALMGTGNSTFGRQPTFLTKADCAVLNRNEIFQPTDVGPYYGVSNSSIIVKAVHNASLFSIDISGSFTSDKTVSELLYWVDPNVNNEGSAGDYNSVAWVAPLVGTNGIGLSIPLSEIQNKANNPSELKVKLLFTDGGVRTYTYDFKFANDIPVFNEPVRVYQHCGFGGITAAFTLGNYTTAQMVAAGIANNDISGVKIPLGIKVVLYDGDNFTGNSIEITSSNNCVTQFNDLTSSIKVLVN